VGPYLRKLCGLHAHIRKGPSFVGYRPKSDEEVKPSPHGAPPRHAEEPTLHVASHTFEDWERAIYCTLVVQGIVLVEQP
jgi:hypothetical protein